MELQGKIIVVLPERSGVSQRGEWKAQTYVMETHDQYPKQMAFDVFGADRIAQFNIKLGDEVSVSFDITAHEYQGRWYNSVRAWNVVHIDPAAVQASAYGMQPGGAMPFPPQSPASYGAAPAQPATQPSAPVSPAPSQEDSADDLPF